VNLPLDQALSRARRGDRDAFEAIYHHAVGRVYALARRLEGHDGEAEDLTQEVFLRVWRARPSFRGDSALNTWIHGIAVRTAIAARADRVRRPTP
jgi:RNA polymerase sigma-70 factor (ECF subfamily)